MQKHGNIASEVGELISDWSIVTSHGTSTMYTLIGASSNVAICAYGVHISNTLVYHLGHCVQS